jgi:hypothetical protein
MTIIITSAIMGGMNLFTMPPIVEPKSTEGMMIITIL